MIDSLIFVSVMAMEPNLPAVQTLESQSRLILMIIGLLQGSHEVLKNRKYLKPNLKKRRFERFNR